MYPLNTNSLRENSTIDGDLYDREGNIILFKGTRLKGRILDFLKAKGIEQVFLLVSEDVQRLSSLMDESLLVSFPQAIGLHSFLERHAESGSIPRRFLESARDDVQMFFEKLADRQKPDVERLRTVSSRLVEFVLGGSASPLRVHDLLFFHDDCASRAINVAILSLFAGRQLGFDRQALCDLAMGALLHDVGALGPDQIDPDIALGEGISPLPTHTHPEIGVRKLKEIGVNDEAVLDIVYNHHERHDGLGYPRRLQGSEIGPAASLVSIADDFVTLASASTPGGFTPGSKAATEIIRDIGKAYKPEVARAFIGAVGIYPVGSFLMISNGQIGMVVGNPSGNVLTPRLMLISNSEGEEIAEPVYLDLARSRNVFVQRVLSPPDGFAFGDR